MCHLFCLYLTQIMVLKIFQFFYLSLFNSHQKKLLLGREYWKGICTPQLTPVFVLFFPLSFLSIRKR